MFFLFFFFSGTVHSRVKRGWVDGVLWALDLGLRSAAPSNAPRSKSTENAFVAFVRSPPCA